jgi:hypothetical protein
MNTAQLAVLLWATVTIAGVLLVLAYMWGAPIFLIAAIAVAAAGLIYALRPHPDARKGVVTKAVLIASAITCLIGLAFFKGDIWPSGFPWPQAPVNLDRSDSPVSPDRSDNPDQAKMIAEDLPLDKVVLSGIALHGSSLGVAILTGVIENRSARRLNALRIGVSFYHQTERVAIADLYMGYSGGEPFSPIEPASRANFEGKLKIRPPLDEPLKNLRVEYRVTKATTLKRYVPYSDDELERDREELRKRFGGTFPHERR